MAVKKTETPEKIVNDKEYWNERVPVTLPLNQGNPEDQTLFVSVNDYAAQIQRGIEVMVPRYVKEVIDQSLKAEYTAFMNRMKLQNEYEAEMRKRM